MATTQDQVTEALIALKNAKRNKSGGYNGNSVWAVVVRFKAYHGNINYEDTEFSRQISAAATAMLYPK